MGAEIKTIIESRVEGLSKRVKELQESINTLSKQIEGVNKRVVAIEDRFEESRQVLERSGIYGKGTE